MNGSDPGSNSKSPHRLILSQHFVIEIALCGSDGQNLPPEKSDTQNQALRLSRGLSSPANRNDINYTYQRDAITLMNYHCVGYDR